MIAPSILMVSATHWTALHYAVGKIEYRLHQNGHGFSQIYLLPVHVASVCETILLLVVDPGPVMKQMTRFGVNCDWNVGGVWLHGQNVIVADIRTWWP